MKSKARNSFEEGENHGKKKGVIASILLIALLIFAAPGCKKSDDLAGMNGDANNAMADENSRSSFSVLYLVSDVAAYHPVNIDTRLVNAWGMASTDDGQIWVNATETGISEIFDADGNMLRRPVSIPSVMDDRMGKPTGIVQNPTRSFFTIPSTGEVSKMIFSTEEGTIAALGSGTSATTVVDRSNVHAVYKGLAVANNNGGWYLYATDFYNGRIDVFDARFNLIQSEGFTDPRMPSRFAPFGIRAFGSKLVVTYALQSDDREDDVAGIGNGYVDLYQADGRLIRRFASGGRLNSPWGIEAYTPPHRSNSPSQLNPDIEGRIILIGNFGDGHINMYDQRGNFLGWMQNLEEPIVIEGLWAISYRQMFNDDMTVSDGRLYFTGGPRDETHGTFGYISSH
jgi:uncharacterized protein (TIGR03118 family)